MPAEPVIHAYHNIECRDAVLEYDHKEPVSDEHGRAVTRWDGRTTKVHPVSGEQVPDESARVPVYRYLSPRKAVWPQADYIVGNPPFLGKLFLLSSQGEGYVAALRTAYEGEVPDSADYVMYWWHKASLLVANGSAFRFGFITTNSITQSFNRRVIGAALDRDPPVSLVFAIPDHPWVDTWSGASVRIAMTVAAKGDSEGRRLEIADERPEAEARQILFRQKWGRINQSLSVGTNVAAALPLRSNRGLASMGPSLGSRGFVVDGVRREELIALDGEQLAARIRPLRNGKDLLRKPRGVYAIDMSGITSATQLQAQFPHVFQHLYTYVYPERTQNNDPKLKQSWWLFRRSNELCRSMLQGLESYIVTVETAKYRTFFLIEGSVLAEHGTISFGISDAYFLGVLSSRVHVTWALAAGGRMGVGNDPRYNKTLCFDPFPFPECSQETRSRIRDLALSLDSHRKRQQGEHPKITITDMYNVFEKLNTGSQLDSKEKLIYEQCLVSVLKQLHDDLDAAVFGAYGWPRSLSEEEILQRLVDLNRNRAAEEARGFVRWLRPEFQSTESAKAATQAALPIETEAEPTISGLNVPVSRQPWPKSLPEQVQAVRAALASNDAGMTPDQLARTFHRARADRVSELLETLTSLGQAREVAGGRYVRA